MNFFKLTLVLLLLMVFTTGCTETSNVGKTIKIEFEKAVKDAPDLKANHLFMVEFWATWCPPCRQSIPHLNELVKKYKGKKITFIGISNEPEKTITDFMKKQPFEYSVCIDPTNKMAKELGVRGIPKAFILSPKGEILWDGHPMTLTETIIDPLLSKIK